MQNILMSSDKSFFSKCSFNFLMEISVFIVFASVEGSVGWPSVYLLAWLVFCAHYWVWRPHLEAGSWGVRTHLLLCHCAVPLNSQAGHMEY